VVNLFCEPERDRAIDDERKRAVKANITMILAYIFGDLPPYLVTCQVCGKQVSIGDCPAGHDDICSDCAIELFEQGERSNGTNARA